MKNRDDFFQKAQIIHFDMLKKKYEDFRQDKDWAITLVNIRFRDIVSKEWNSEVMEGRESIAGRKHFTKNKFLQEIFAQYRYIIGEYPKNPIHNFMNYDYVEIKERHLENFNDNHEQDYTFKTELLTENNEERFLNWLAKALLYKSYFEDNNLFTPELNIPNEKLSDNKKIVFVSPGVKRMKEDNRTALSLNETAYLFKLLKKGKIFLDREFQRDIQIANAAHLLTGYSNETLRRRIPKGNSEFSDDEKKKVLEKIEKIKTLIINDLKE